MLRWFEKRHELSFFILIMGALGIFFVSSLSFSNASASTGFLSLIYHISAFFLFALFLLITVVKGKYRNLVPICFVMAVLYGVSDEIHQYLVPGRSASTGDVFLDTIGIIFANLIYLISLEFRK